MITLGVQDASCLTCNDLEFDRRPIPTFFYEDMCKEELPDCSANTLYPVGDKSYFVQRPGTQRTETVVQSRSNFMSSLIPRCDYSYSLQKCNGGQAPNYYSISNEISS